MITYTSRHWHAMALGAAAYWVIMRFVAPMVMTRTGRNGG